MTTSMEDQLCTLSSSSSNGRSSNIASRTIATSTKREGVSKEGKEGNTANHRFNSSSLFVVIGQ